MLTTTAGGDVVVNIVRFHISLDKKLIMIVKENCQMCPTKMLVFNLFPSRTPPVEC